MSELRHKWQQRRRTTHADSGMTLPELLISVIVTGTLVTGLAVAATVVLRQGDNNKGRLNNSRSEQSVGLWMPADLASAEYVDTNPASSPCGTACPADVTSSCTGSQLPRRCQGVSMLIHGVYSASEVRRDG